MIQYAIKFEDDSYHISGGIKLYQKEGHANIRVSQNRNSVEDMISYLSKYIPDWEQSLPKWKTAYRLERDKEKLAKLEKDKWLKARVVKVELKEL